jgi:hypothetical protein
MHVDPFDPETFLWLLEDADVPYVEHEWDKVRNTAFAKDPKKLGSVFGKYLSKMRIMQYKEYSWKDTEWLRNKEEEDKKRFLENNPDVAIRDAQLKKQFESGQISEAQYKTLASANVQKQSLDEQAMGVIMSTAAAGSAGVVPGGPAPLGVSQEVMAEFVDPGKNLTNEDKIYLATKWGSTYQPSDWIALENFYNEMCESFDIQDADTISTLKLICKTNLKMNQAIDIGDVETFNKLSRAYEAMRKSAKFTAAQKKEQETEFVDCVGNMVAYCEREGGRIPAYDISTDKDVIDKIIKDLKEYNRNLIYTDTSLARQIEEYIALRKAMDENKRDREEAEAKGLEVPELTDKDLVDYEAAIAEGHRKDNEIEE